jgi:hypothetical protein
MQSIMWQAKLNLSERPLVPEQILAGVLGGPWSMMQDVSLAASDSRPQPSG